MKRRNFITLCSAAVTGVALAGASKSVKNRPNVVFIYGDDVGYGDSGAYGATMIPTPNIDRLAKESLLFTDGHCTAATCTPSRFSLLTGIHGFRYNARVLPPDAPLLIPLDKMTLPELFKAAGYHTGVIGKWHLGIGDGVTPVDWNSDVKPGPLEVGFDYSFLLPSTNDRVPCVYLENHRVLNLDPNDPLYLGHTLAEVNKPGSTQYPDGKTDRAAMTYYQSTHGHDNSVINGIGRIGYQSGGKSALWNGETMTDEFVARAKAYISEHRNEPFFLHYCAQNVHVPRTPAKRFQGKTKLGYRGDSMVEFDWTTGQILQALEDNGLTENTIVIFSSDNGPTYNDGYDDGTTVLCSNEELDRGHDGSGIWRGGKYQIFEGGTRVPFIIRWPGHIKPGTSDAMVNQIDLFASFAELLDVDIPAGSAVDSRSTLATFLGKKETGQEFMIEESFGLALRHKEWKYTRPSHPKWPKNRPPIERALYNLKDDPGEQKNIIAAHPEIADEMEQKLDKMVTSKGIRQPE